MIHFMSVLGTGAYDEVAYYWGNGEKAANFPKACDMPDKPEHSRTSRFIQIASLTKLMETEKERRKIKVSIFLTDAARAANWEHAKRKGDKNAASKNGGGGTCEVIPGFKPELMSFASGYPDTEFEIEDIRIAEGADQAEQEEIFNKIFENINTGDVVYFDLTHGLRSLPIMALMTILNYARTVKNITVGGLYYGAYEVGDRERKLAPIFDMNYCDNILQWSSAAESFVMSGSANQIKELYDRTNEANKKNNNGDLKVVEDTVRNLKDLTSCLETSRGRMYGKKLKTSQSIFKAYEAYKASYKGMLKNTEGTNQIPLKNLFGVIDDDLKVFDRKIIREKCDPMPEKILGETSLGVAAVQWAVNKGLIQQGLTALEATVITYVCEM